MLKVASRIGVACFTGFLLINSAFAAVEDSQFTVSPDGMSIQFELRNVPRREVLDHLFSNRGISLSWVDKAAADEPISGSFSGSPDVVAKQLLAPLDFVLGYEQTESKPKIVRVVIVGRSSKQARPALAQLAAAMLPNSTLPDAGGSGGVASASTGAAQANPGAALPGAMQPTGNPQSPSTGALTRVPGRANMPTAIPGSASADSSTMLVPLPAPVSGPLPVPLPGPSTQMPITPLPADTALPGSNR